MSGAECVDANLFARFIEIYEILAGALSEG